MSTWRPGQARSKYQVLGKFFSDRGNYGLKPLMMAVQHGIGFAPLGGWCSEERSGSQNDPPTGLCGGLGGNSYGLC